MKKIDYYLTIGWLYPDLMSTYGDRGNIIVLSKRCEELGIKADVKRIGLEQDKKEILESDILFMGGAQDKQQEIVNKDLLEKKGNNLKSAIENNVPGLFICGAYQFLGRYYKTADGMMIDGLSIFDLYTENPGIHNNRLIGDIIVRIDDLRFKINDLKKEGNIHKSNLINHKSLLVGFENHGGRTYLGKNIEPFAKVIHGYGNNGGDKTEGIFYKNAIGTYLHGPILPKNWELADFLIQKAIFTKYNRVVEIKDENHVLEDEAKQVIVRRYLS